MSIRTGIAHYVWIAVFTLCLCGAWTLIYGSNANAPFAIALVAGVISWFFGIQKQRADDLRLFKELFVEFNRRYDVLNDHLNCIVSGPGDAPLTPEELKHLNDYFNLCGEEYLFYSEGYIYTKVWHAWRNGMGFFYASPRIHAVWKKDLKFDSY